MRYPLGEYEAEQITSRTGKKLSDITLDAVKRGEIKGRAEEAGRGILSFRQ